MILIVSYQPREMMVDPPGALDPPTMNPRTLWAQVRAL
jgi:hypothetical protein